MAQDAKTYQATMEANTNRLNVEIEGEGNYSSTASSDTIGPMTDQQLTPQPEIQPTDALLSQATGYFHDLDLDGILGLAPPSSTRANVTPKKAAWLAEIFGDDDADEDEDDDQDEDDLSNQPSKKMRLANKMSKDPASGYQVTTPAEV